VFREEVLEEDADDVAEDDRVGDLHHGGLQVYGEQEAFLLGGGDLGFEEGEERALAEDGGVEDLSGLEREFVFEDGGFSVGAGELDADGGGGGERDGALVGEKVVAPHGGDAGAGVG